MSAMHKTIVALTCHTGTRRRGLAAAGHIQGIDPRGCRVWVKHIIRMAEVVSGEEQALEITHRQVKKRLRIKTVTNCGNQVLPQR